MEIILEKRVVDVDDDDELFVSGAKYAVRSKNGGAIVAYLGEEMAIELYPKELSELAVNIVIGFLSGMKKHGILEHVTKDDLNRAIENILK